MSGIKLMRRISRLSPFPAAVVSACALFLGACGGDGLELNGKLFDAMGVSAAAQKASTAEPKLAPRTGIVMPPDASRLPEPGSGGAPDIAAQLNDPDKIRQAAVADRARQHKLYCSGDLNWKERAANKDQASAPQSPYGPCTLLGDQLKQ